ncbi:MAG: alkaline shock response membrane anchor protein AmaP [Clostridia bacterium]|nr:MAG: alkaline shock response membrane anchor protein AmaP [Clostridia bacterium]
MNTLNRLITFLLFLFLFVVFVLFAAAPFDTLRWIQVQTGSLIHLAQQTSSQDALLFNLIRVAFAAVAIFVLLPFMLAEFHRKSEPAVKVRTANGEIRVTADSIAKRLSWHLDQLADVIDVLPVVDPRGDKVNVNLDVETSPEVDVPMKTEEIMLVTKEVIETHMGLKMGKLSVNIRHAPYPEPL